MNELSSQIENAVLILSKKIIEDNFRGYDPYDGLSSPIFSLPILKSNKLLRFGFQQIFRRIPINIRPLLGIKKEINPVTLGLCIKAFTYMSQIFTQNRQFYKVQIDNCLNGLVELKSSGYSGACWGYNFDWEARYAKIPAYFPTIVATGIIVNGLYEYYKFSRDLNVKSIILDSTNFVLNDLNRTIDGEDFCFSYSPSDKQVVFNATMKAARLLSQAYDISNDESYRTAAKRTVNFVMKHQSNEGYWVYSSNDDRAWIDNFHTAYVLDSLSSYINLTGDEEYMQGLKIGINFYKNTFFTPEFIPKYYSNKIFPIDSTAVAQSIITLLLFNDRSQAKNIIKWALENMINRDGSIVYRKHRFMRNNINYIRWSNAWFFLALSIFLIKTQKPL